MTREPKLESNDSLFTPSKRVYSCLLSMAYIQNERKEEAEIR